MKQDREDPWQVKMCSNEKLNYIMPHWSIKSLYRGASHETEERQDPWQIKMWSNEKLFHIMPHWSIKCLYRGVSHEIDEERQNPWQVMMCSNEKLYYMLHWAILNVYTGKLAMKTGRKRRCGYIN